MSDQILFFISLHTCYRQFFSQSSWSGLASGPWSIEWWVSKFIIFLKWYFTWGSGAVWKFNPLRLGISVELDVFHVSGLISSSFLMTVVVISNWVSTVTGWVKLSVFLLSYLMFLIWDNNVFPWVDNWVIDLKIGSSWGICWSWWWCCIDTSEDFAGSNNSVRKIFFKSNFWKSKCSGTWAVW